MPEKMHDHYLSELCVLCYIDLPRSYGHIQCEPEADNKIKKADTDHAEYDHYCVFHFNVEIKSVQRSGHIAGGECDVPDIVRQSGDISYKRCRSEHKAQRYITGNGAEIVIEIIGDLIKPSWRKALAQQRMILDALL